MDEEYITMGMAAYGKTGLNKTISKDLLADAYNIEFKRNLHTGIGGDYPDDNNENLARAAQDICEELVYNVMDRAANFKWSTNLCYMGGVALNCLANRKLGDYFDNIWIMPNPGDAGSSLGASALVHGGKLNWVNAYLGHLITGNYPVNSAIDYLLSDHMVGVASGRAEFGPRALGNRSLLADPRGTTIKDQVNEIKRRQKFRPFSPVILEEYADKYFVMPTGWTDTRYMQIVAKCWQPNNYPAICHVDHTSRVQTVPKDGSGIRQLLEKWYAITGCPMLLNTSLNIRGEPMVNDLKDAKRFEKEYNVKVVS
jgi:carbamoyltransferase